MKTANDVWEKLESMPDDNYNFYIIAVILAIILLFIMFLKGCGL